jgi:hypothetical protein
MGIVKTEAGKRVLKDRSVPLSRGQRSAFILFDGQRGVPEVLAATSSMGVTRADIAHLFSLGLLARTPSPDSDAMEAVAPVRQEVTDSMMSESIAVRSPQQRYLQAYPIATKLTAKLGLRGFRLNLAVEAAAGYDELCALAPRIRDVVSDSRFFEFDVALNR